MRTISVGGACRMLALAGWVTAAGAVNTSWIGGDGAWTNGALWSAGVVPAGGDTVMVTNAGPDDLVIAYVNPGNPSLGYLGMERTSGGMLVVTQSQDSLTVTGSVRIGMSPGSNVRFVQNGGTNIFGVGWPNTISIGHTAGATSVYHLVSGCLGANGNFGGYAVNIQIGSGGKGVFIQEGGLHHGATTFSTADGANKELVLGGMRSPQQAYNYNSRTTGGDGTYLLSGGTVCFRNVYVGCIEESRGAFVQTGGSNLFENIYIGRFGSGSYLFEGGNFLNSTLYLGGYGGTGVLTQTGGVIGGNKVYARLFVGYGATNSAGLAGLGGFNMFGGAYKPYYSEFRIGVDGRGVLIQTNGSVRLTDHSGTDKYTACVGYTNGAFGSFALSGGEFWSKTLSVGYAGTATGEVRQTGGTLAVGGASFGGLVVGGNESAVGVYLFGDADATGLITNTMDTTGNDLTVRLAAGADGTFSGWGEVHLNDTLLNNGQVVADGYGSARTLSLERFARVSNTVENAAGEAHGWYAQNGGKLTLPRVTVATGDGSVNWGESAGDAELDLVNSLRFVFTGVTGGGVLTNSLLAADRAELPPLPEGFKSVGVWQVQKPAALGYGTLGMTFRYDDARMEALGLKELKLLHAAGGVWHTVPGTMNADACLYSAASVVLGADNYFALGRGPYGTLIGIQ